MEQPLIREKIQPAGGYILTRAHWVDVVAASAILQIKSRNYRCSASDVSRIGES
jgi:hypothetical protein